MPQQRLARNALGLALLAALTLGAGGAVRAAEPFYQGAQAFGGALRDAPGVRHKITLGDLPPPFAPAAVPTPRDERRAESNGPQVLPGFSV